MNMIVVKNAVLANSVLKANFVPFDEFAFMTEDVSHFYRRGIFVVIYMNDGTVHHLKFDMVETAEKLCTHLVESLLFCRKANQTLEVS
jgi:hypothetical protein